MVEALADALVLVDGPSDARRVVRVALVDALDELSGAGRGALAILTRRASAELEGYQLDVAVRLAGQAGLAAVVVAGAGAAGVTTARLAERADVAVLGRPADGDTGELLVRADRLLRPDASAGLGRLDELHELLLAADEEPGLAAAASRVLGTTVRVVADNAPGATVVVGGRAVGVVTTDTDGSVERLAARLVADRLAHIREHVRRVDAVDVRARTRLILDLLSASDARVEAAVEQARDRRLALDRRHRVLRVEPAVPGVTAASAASLEEAARIAAGLLGRDRGWLVAGTDEALVCVRTASADDRAELADVLDRARRLLDRLAEAQDAVPFVAGVGGPHAGVEGLRASDAEATSALAAARRNGSAGQVTVFDATGLQRSIAEWASTPTARRAVDEALAPLDALGAARAETAIRTLQAYLDERGSLVAAGRRLHLHPNAVAYRLRGIRRLLEVDVDDPEGRLVLQLACHARLGALGGGGRG